MLHFMPSPSAAEHLLLYRKGTPIVLCLCCGDTMKHRRTIAPLGVRPEQHIFVCPSCKAVETKALNRVA
ncbi:MAG: hypothetical protein ABSE22_15725 [Xanthobacteraceae bacterium]|jgi:hypothetical protein